MDIVWHHFWDESQLASSCTWETVPYCIEWMEEWSECRYHVQSPYRARILITIWLELILKTFSSLLCHSLFSFSNSIRSPFSTGAHQCISISYIPLHCIAFMAIHHRPHTTIIPFMCTYSFTLINSTQISSTHRFYVNWIAIGPVTIR